MDNGLVNMRQPRYWIRGRQTSTGRPPWLLWLCTLALVCGSLIQTSFGYSDITHRAPHAWGSDDAYISYRYALNLARGDGLVFNPASFSSGQYADRVEGYSNLLYVLIMAAGVLVAGKYNLFLFSIWFNILCLVLSLFIFESLIRLRLKPQWHVTALMVFVLTAPLWLWVSSGLETSLTLLVALSITLLVNLLIAGVRVSILLIILVILLSIFSRADGFFLPIISGGYLLVNRKYKWSYIVFLICFCSILAITLWRLYYYGDILPNTFYVKVVGALLYRLLFGAVLLNKIAWQQGLWIYLIAILVTVVAEARRYVTHREEKLAFSLECTFSILLVGYWLFIGGDVYFDRFLMPLFPLGVIILLGKLDDQRWTQGLVRNAIGLSLVGLSLLTLKTDSRFAYTDKKYDAWITLGLFLGNQFPGQTLAVDAAGKIPYFAELPTIDMLGLNDRFIAKQPPKSDVVGHAKFDSAYTLSQSPTLITAWINPDLDLDYGLDRNTYLAAGYEIGYLVSMLDESPDSPVLDVRRYSLPAIRDLIAAGYTYGVLVKKDAFPNDRNLNPVR